MKYYMLEAYQKIPQYAEVEFIEWCYCSGYSCALVKYKGIEYKPLASQLMSEQSIQNRLQHTYEAYFKWKQISKNTIKVSYL